MTRFQRSPYARLLLLDCYSQLLKTIHLEGKVYVILSVLFVKIMKIAAVNICYLLSHPHLLNNLIFFVHAYVCFLLKQIANRVGMDK